MQNAYEMYKLVKFMKFMSKLERNTELCQKSWFHFAKPAWNLRLPDQGKK